MSKTADGKPINIIGTHTDITDLKEVELSLEKSEKQFRSLSENLPGVVYEYVYPIEGPGYFKFISPSLEKIFGISIDQLKASDEIIPPEEAESIAAVSELSRQTNCPFYFEGRFIIPGKNDIWYSSSSSFSYEDNNGERVYTGIIIDITEKKLSEERIENKENFTSGY